MIKKVIHNGYLQELALNERGAKRGNLYDELHKLIKEHGMEEVDWILKVIKEDLQCQS